MKILITTDWPEQAVNGVATSVKNLKAGLLQAGNEVRVLTLSGDISSRKEGDTYYIGSMSAGVIYPNVRLKLMMPHKLMRDILDWKPDIVHSQCIFSTFPLAREIAYACKVPLVNTYHTVYEDFTHYLFPSRAVGKEIVKLYSKTILMDTQAVIVPTEKIRELLRGYGVEQPIYVIPSAIDTERYQSSQLERRETIRAELGIHSDECVLIYVGRLAKEKNIEELFRFLKKMQPGPAASGGRRRAGPAKAGTACARTRHPGTGDFHRVDPTAADCKLLSGGRYFCQRIHQRNARSDLHGSHGVRPAAALPRR